MADVEKTPNAAINCLILLPLGVPSQLPDSISRELALGLLPVDARDNSKPEITVKLFYSAGAGAGAGAG